MGRTRRTRLTFLIIAVVLATAVILRFWDQFASLVAWVDQDRIHALVLRLGAFGPILIIALMCAAVVFSPLPSAPIALAAGAAYGHYLGAVYVVIGAESGALIAFALARWLGRDMVRRWVGRSLPGLSEYGSQTMLMWAVFISRLMPFLSFDLVSYAAGLSPLTFWRFALATFAGIIPASFILAHFGGEIANGSLRGALWIAFGLGLMTGLPLLAALWTKNRAQKETGPTP